MIFFYCPNCWSRIEEDEKVCPKCKAEIKAFDHLSYFEKLVRALNHSERTTRIRAADGKSVTSGFSVTLKIVPLQRCPK
jgi:transcription initiation factor IIE alpha subunit